jgi:hypothetical protein
MFDDRESKPPETVLYVAQVAKREKNSNVGGEELGISESLECISDWRFENFTVFRSKLPHLTHGLPLQARSTYRNYSWYFNTSQLRLPNQTLPFMKLSVAMPVVLIAKPTDHTSGFIQS